MTDDYEKYKNDKVIRFVDSLKNGWRKFPPSLQIGITDHCFNKCPMCGHWKRPHLHELNLDTLINFLEFGKKHGLETVGYSGGDPMKYPRLNKLLSWHIKNAIGFGIVTAGYRPESIDMELLRHAEWVRCSLDSTGHRTYDKVRGGSIGASDVMLSMAAMVAEDVKVGAGITLHAQNCSGLARTIMDIANIGVKEIRVWPIRDHSGMSIIPSIIPQMLKELDIIIPRFKDMGIDNNLMTIYEMLDKRDFSNSFDIPFKRCYATMYQLFLDADGSLYPCCTGAGDTEKENRLPSFGNINTLHELEWNGVWEDIVSYSEIPYEDLPEVCKKDCIVRHRIANKIAGEAWPKQSFQ